MSTPEWTEEDEAAAVRAIRTIEEVLSKLSTRGREHILERLAELSGDSERSSCEWRLALAIGKPKGKQ